MTTQPLSSDSPPVRLSGRRLALCLMVLGWSERLAAERCRMHRTSFVRCLNGTSRLPPDLSAWLLAREAALLAIPFPRIPVTDPVYLGSQRESEVYVP